MKNRRHFGQYHIYKRKLGDRKYPHDGIEAAKVRKSKAFRILKTRVLLTNSYSPRRKGTIITKYSTFIESDMAHLTNFFVVLPYIVTREEKQELDSESAKLRITRNLTKLKEITKGEK